MELQRSALLAFLANEGITPEVMLEAAEARFAPLFYPRFFRTLDPTVSLEYETIISNETLEAMATVGSRESEYPLHSRGGLEKLKGEVPPIFLRRKLNAQERRNLEILLGSNALGLPQRLREVMAREVEDFVYCRNAIQRRLDSMAKQAVFNGKISITLDNNPNGIVFDLPLLSPDNLLVSNGDWDNVDTDIVKDFENVRLKSLITGVPFEAVLISEYKWFKIINNKSLQNLLKGFMNPGSNARYAFTLENINAVLTANRFPVFEIISDLAYVQIDGKKSATTSINVDNAVFIPGGDLGLIHNALADEQITPMDNVTYLVSDNILLSRFREPKPVAEITEGVYNAFPGLSQAKNIFILNTKGA
jgi:Phage major capsid protein E